MKSIAERDIFDRFKRSFSPKVVHNGARMKEIEVRHSRKDLVAPQVIDGKEGGEEGVVVSPATSESHGAGKSRAGLRGSGNRTVCRGCRSIYIYIYAPFFAKLGCVGVVVSGVGGYFDRFRFHPKSWPL